MIRIPALADKSIAVFGLGQSGLVAATALLESGARVQAWDDNAASRQRAEEAAIPLVDLNIADWQGVELLLLSPGVPLHHPVPHPVVLRAREAGAEIIGDIELLALAQKDSRYIGITGTNGKSTTTALIGHVLQSAGVTAEVGGNLGVPAMSFDALGGGGTYVLEMSSYQLELTHSLDFDIAVLLNLSPDHLDRHGDMDGYIAAKKRIFDGQDEASTAIVGVDDAFSRAVADTIRQRGGQQLITVSGAGPVAGGVYTDNGILIDDTKGRAEAVCDLTPITSLPGNHNGQNAAAAYAIAKASGLERDAIVAGIESYPGLAHRQEHLGWIDGIAFVNDSKATNGEAAARAVASYADVYWIAGGLAKEDGLAPVAAYLDHVRHAYLIGEAAPAFSQELDQRVPVTLSGELQPAVIGAYEQAKSDALADPVVLLSPACASFDQFPNFEARGDTFRDIVHDLPGTRSTSAVEGAA